MNEQETSPPQGEAPDFPRPDPAIAPEIARTVGSILDAVEREAARLREEARAEADRYLEQSRLRADQLVEERRQRIAELSDELITKSEAVVRRLDDAAPVRHGFDNLVRALAGAAERLARARENGAAEFRSPPYHGSAEAPEPPSPPQPAPSTPPRPAACPATAEPSRPRSALVPDLGDGRGAAVARGNRSCRRRWRRSARGGDPDGERRGDPARHPGAPAAHLREVVLQRGPG